MGEKLKESRFHYGFFVVIALCSLCFAPVAMSFNTAGLFYSPVSTDLGITPGEFGRYMTVQYAALAIAMPFAGKLFVKVDSRIMLSISVLGVAGGLCAMSMFNALWQFFIAAIFIGAVNSILLYLMVPILIDRWFIKNVGLFVGICFAFTGIGGVVLNPLVGFFVDTVGWRMSYLIEGLIVLVLCLPLSIFAVRSFPKDKGVKPYGFGAAKASDSLDSGKKKSLAPIKGVSFKRALRSPAFYVMTLHAGLMEMGLTLNYYIPSYINSLGETVLVASTVSAAIMLGQTLGKIALGKINDWNVRAGVIAAVSSGAIGIGMMAFFGGLGLWVFYIGGFIFGVYFAGLTVTTSLMTREFFPGRDYGQIFSFVAMAAAVAAAFSSTLWGVIVDVSGSYTTMLTVGFCLIISILFVGALYFKLGKKVVPDLEDVNPEASTVQASTVQASTE